jgi:hypothetical protein
MISPIALTMAAITVGDNRGFLDSCESAMLQGCSMKPPGYNHYVLKLLFLQTSLRLCPLPQISFSAPIPHRLKYR